MKTKKEVVVFSLLIVVLVIAIGFAASSVSGEKSKEVKGAKEFVQKLQKSNIIDTELNLNEVEFKAVEKATNKSFKSKYTVVAENIEIDLDSEYVVTGFSQKVNEVKSISLINENEAKLIAEEYVSEIADEKFSFKEVRALKAGEESSTTYTVAFYKYIKNYPYYDNEIVVNINKNTGKLESYSNQTINKVSHNIDKSIEEEEAINIAKDHFNKLNVKAELSKKPLLAVTLKVDGEFELSYIIDVNTTNAEGKTDKFKLFINAESGEVSNRTTELIETSRSN